jgi:hypothetical protein
MGYFAFFQKGVKKKESGLAYLFSHLSLFDKKQPLPKKPFHFEY